MRFVILSCLFLAVAFYQLSGGADFDPKATLASRIDGPLPEPVEIDAETPEEIARVSLELTSMQEILSQRARRRLPNAVQARQVLRPTDDTSDVAELEPDVIVPVNFSEAAVIAPVKFGTAVDNEPVVTEAAAASTPLAIEVSNAILRSVSGSRVNVRGGPGTDFNVVASLSRGDQVEVINDPGNGWVQMRPVSGGPTGWMADFLLTDG